MNFSENNLFEGLGLSPKVLSRVKSLGFSAPTPIQEQCIPSVLEGRDILGQAQTGTGKTAAFALPILTMLDDVRCMPKHPEVLVLAPTRELAMQVSEAFEDFAKDFQNLDTFAIYGGQDYSRQMKALSKGVKIVVGTTGRIMDHMQRGSLKLDNLQFLVLDEADEMLRMGFIDDVKWILNHIPDSCQRLLFSATMPRDVMGIVNSSLRDPFKVQIKSTTNTASTIRQKYVVISGISKIDALDRILSVEDSNGIIVFVRTKNDTVTVANGLKDLGYNSAAMNGDMSQSQREMIISNLKDGKVKILVATDVVARGLDVECITHVINYELPQDNEAYVHRIGRTGRAGREGDAISLVYGRELGQLRTLQRIIKQELQEIPLPNGSDISKKRIIEFKNKLIETINSEDLKLFTNLAEDIITENRDLEINSIVGSLIFLAQKDKQLFVPNIAPRPVYEPREPRSNQGNRNSRFDNGPRERGNDRFGTRGNFGGNSGNRRNFEDRGNFEGRGFGNRNLDGGDTKTYKIEVGAIHGLQAKNIVGAIANEAGIPSSNIGQIKIHDEYSTVKLPANLNNAVLSKLKTIRIMNLKSNIQEMS